MKLRSVFASVMALSAWGVIVAGCDISSVARQPVAERDAGAHGPTGVTTVSPPPPRPGCAAHMQGGPTSCKSADVWSKYAADDCAASHQVLGDLTPREDCGGGWTRFVDYTCCASGAATDTITVDGCSWPTALAATQPTSMQCWGAARAVLSCDGAAGGASCVTSAPECDTSNTNVVGPFSCQNHCGPSEFGVACGQVGPTSDAATPPPNCRAVLVTPGGIAFYCCPCAA